MTSDKPWARTFRISPQQIAEWEDIAPADTPLSVWAIEQGHINADEFLNWAQEFYHLPVVQSEFFEAAVEFNRPEGNWTPWLVPVSEWDGTLFVACTEPPMDFSYPSSVQFVLAIPSDLAKSFEQKSPPPIEMPEGLTQVVKRAVLQLGEEYETETPEAQATPPVAAQVAAQGAQSSSDEITGLTAIRSRAVDLTTGEYDSINEAEANAELYISEKTVVTSSQTSYPPVDLEATQTRMAAFRPEELAPIPPTPPIPMPKISQGHPEVNQETAITLVSKTALPASPKSLKEAKSLEAAFAWAFSQVTGRYSHAMALQETDHQMLPWLWTANWTAPEKVNNKATSLDQPSLFRIAGKTRRPYHGFIVESDIHRQFFNSWGFATLPPCATAIPIVVLDHVWGLLLCVGDESSESPEALKLAETVVEKLADFIRSQLAAA